MNEASYGPTHALVPPVEASAGRRSLAASDLVVEGESYRARLKPTVDETSPPPTTPVTKPDHPIRKRRR